MIELVPNEKCCGCSACFNACKTGAITMETDDTGFWFPRINKEECIECGACRRACPAFQKPEFDSADPKAYIVQNKDDEIRRQSTSGGAFTAIAKHVIESGGVVFGAAMDETYEVSHIWVDNEKGLEKFRSSKYVQSRIGNTYREAENFLKKGRVVCFSGTPCQIYGLKNYLDKIYENLITVDVMCRAVPSPKVLKKYLEFQKEKYPGFDRIVFRDKGRGYSYSCVTLYQGEKVLYRGGSESDPWLRLFLGGYCNRETCHECQYQNGARASDITLWDCWGTQNYAPEWDDNKGTTTMVVWSEKGQALINLSTESLRLKEISMNSVEGVLKRKPLSRAKCDKKIMYQDCETDTPKQFMDKYVPATYKIIAKKNARMLIHSLHLHDIVRKSIHRIRKRNSQ